MSKILMEKFPLPHFRVEMEFSLNSINSTGKKRCDIVVLKLVGPETYEPYIVFPVKIIKTNYKQNRNNAWENLTGELTHLKWADGNEHLKIIPINIFMNKTPYLLKDKKIENFENITIEDISTYNILKTKQIVYDMINYIMIVEHHNIIGEPYDKVPNIIGFDTDTPFRSMFDILKDL
jgi:hypothetical protein